MRKMIFLFLAIIFLFISGCKTNTLREPIDLSFLDGVWNGHISSDLATGNTRCNLDSPLRFKVDNGKVISVGGGRYQVDSPIRSDGFITVTIPDFMHFTNQEMGVDHRVDLTFFGWLSKNAKGRWQSGNCHGDWNASLGHSSSGAVSKNFSVAKSAIISQYPEKGHTLESITSKSEFDPLIDKNIVLAIWLDNRHKKYNLRFQLISPQSRVFFEHERIQTQEGTYSSIYSTAKTSSLGLSRFPGEWKSKIYVDNEFAASDKFMVLERPEMIASINEFLATFPYHKAGINYVDLSKIDNIRERYGIEWPYGKGVIVDKIYSNSLTPSLRQKDIIVEIDGNKISSGDDFAFRVRHPNNPKKVEIYLFRPSEQKYKTLTIEVQRIKGSDDENIFKYQGLMDDFYAWYNDKEKFSEQHPYFSKSRH